MQEIKDFANLTEEQGNEPFDIDNIPSADMLLDMVNTKEYPKLRRIAEDIPPQDLAEIFSEIDLRHLLLIYRLLSKEKAAETFVELDSELQEELIKAFSDSELSAILDELYIDDTVDIIEEMPATLVKKILRSASGESRHVINRLLRYDRDTAGAIMTTEYVRLKPTMTVKEALYHIKAVAIDKETIYTCYVTDDYRHLLGIVTAKSLMLSDADVTLDSIMEENVIYANTQDSQEDVALMFDKYGFIALPVVDSERRLVGIVTVDDAIDVLREEVEEDIAKMAGITPDEKSYTRRSVFELWRSRIPWLLLLMISATISSTILSRFEAMLPAALILFVPMLMDTGGNSGGQTSVTVIRSLSLGEIAPKNILYVLYKELRVGIMAGAALSVVSFLKVVLIDRLLMNNTDVTYKVAAIVSISLGITIVLAKLIGASLPIIAKKLHLDPAVMASPFITTIVDAISLLLYFAIASIALAM